VDEYVETIPSAGGNKPSVPRGPNRRGPDGQIGPKARADLERLGSDGRAVVQLAELTGNTGHTDGGPSASGARSESDGSGRSADQGLIAGAGRDEGLSPVEALIKPIVAPAPGGMGPALPLLMVSAALIGAGAAVRRSRRS
jgi:hypothetical protein